MTHKNTPRWKQLQTRIANIASELGYSVYEEKPIAQGRADIFLERTTPQEWILGFLELKDYKKLTPKIEQNAIKQVFHYLLSYLTGLSTLPNQALLVFAGVVLTNDGMKSPRYLSNQLLVNRWAKNEPSSIKAILNHGIYFISGKEYVWKIFNSDKLKGTYQTKIDDFSST